MRFSWLVKIADFRHLFVTKDFSETTRKHIASNTTTTNTINGQISVKYALKRPSSFSQQVCSPPEPKQTKRADDAFLHLKPPSQTCRQNKHRLYSCTSYHYEIKLLLTIYDEGETKEEIGELRCCKNESIWRPFFCLHRVPTSFWTIFCTNGMIICAGQQYKSNVWAWNKNTKTVTQYVTMITAKQIIFLQTTSSHQNLNPFIK